MKSIVDILNSSILKENKLVAKFDKNITLTFTITKSPHSEERQGRDENDYISDDEILETVRKASETIINDLVNNKIDIDDRFIVRDANTNLNIVCVAHHGKSNEEIKIDIVTVIRTEKFWNTQKNWVVMIR